MGKNQDRFKVTISTITVSAPRQAKYNQPAKLLAWSCGSNFLVYLAPPKSQTPTKENLDHSNIYVVYIQNNMCSVRVLIADNTMRYNYNSVFNNHHVSETKKCG